MKNNLMIQRVRALQNEYHDLLVSIRSKMNHSTFQPLLDEVCLFWNKNMKLVRLYLKHYISNQNSFVFTAATYLDYSAKEHLPFLIIGDNHIMDDPLCAYAQIYGKTEKGKIQESLYKQITLTIDDNISIIENCQEQIVVLPLRLLNQMLDNTKVLELGEAAFLSLFSDINSIDEVLSIDSIEEIENHLKPDMSDVIAFLENEDMTSSLRERFEKGMKEHPFIDGGKTDGFNFCMMVYSPIQQSVDVVLSCVEYGCIPYLRYPLAFHYSHMLLNGIKDQLELNEMEKGMSIAFCIHKICNKDRLGAADFSSFLEHKGVFSEELNRQLKSLKGKDSFTVREIVPIINECMEKLYQSLGV